MILITLLTLLPFYIHFREDLRSIKAGEGDKDKTKDIIDTIAYECIIAVLSSFYLVWVKDINVKYMLLFMISHGLLSAGWHIALFDGLIAVKALKKPWRYLGKTSKTDQWIQSLGLNSSLVVVIRFVILALTIGFYWWVNFC